MASSRIFVCLLVIAAVVHGATGQASPMLGSGCSDTSGCGKIPNAVCGTRKGVEARRCYCIDGFRPSDDLMSCQYVDVTRFAEGTLNVGEWAGLFIGLSILLLVALTLFIHFRNKRNKNVEV